MEKQIETIARGICVRGGKALACRNRRTGNIFPPGGHIEFGETGAEALRREIAEEMGVAAVVWRLLCICENAFIDESGRAAAEISLVYEFSWQGADGATPPPSAEAHLEFLWLGLDAAAETGNPRKLFRALPQILAGAGSIII